MAIVGLIASELRGTLRIFGASFDLDWHPLRELLEVLALLGL